MPEYNYCKINNASLLGEYVNKSNREKQVSILKKIKVWNDWRIEYVSSKNRNHD